MSITLQKGANEITLVKGSNSFSVVKPPNTINLTKGNTTIALTGGANDLSLNRLANGVDSINLYNSSVNRTTAELTSGNNSFDITQQLQSLALTKGSVSPSLSVGANTLALQLQATVNNIVKPAEVTGVVCQAGDDQGDLIHFIDPVTPGTLEVERVDPRFRIKMPAIGIIKEKTTATEATVLLYGYNKGLYSGLTINEALYVGIDGRITTTPPTPSIGGSIYIQFVGETIGFDEIVFWPNHMMIKENG